MALVCKELNDGSRRDAHRVVALDHISAIYRIIAVSGDIVSPAARRAMTKHNDGFLLQYHWLAQHSSNQGHMCYRMTATFHVLSRKVDYL